jgi:hypothetical protein
MDTPDLEALRLAYKQAVDAWVAAIRAEEALATPDHSETAWERWDDAENVAEEAAGNAKQARDHYKDGLRKVNLGF